MLADTWMGRPNAEGSVFVRKGTVVMIAPDNAGMIAEYGGAGNLAAVTPAAMEGVAEGADQADMAN